ncbi:MAG: hypothetical protein QF809_05090, partial [Candidatus Peribacteraceae bacterium]|nr:hypothetical protein [Candidatus Peribacteraceae bacterium]
MDEQKHPLNSVTEMQEFLRLEGDSSPVIWGREERQKYIGEVLELVGYERLSREDKGVVRQYLQVTAGYSRAQVARVIKENRELPSLVLVEASQVEKEVQVPGKPWMLRTAVVGLVCLLLLLIGSDIAGPKS